MTTPTIRRPGLVTLVVVLTVLGGIGNLMTGIMALMISNGSVFAGVVFIVLGLVYLAVAKGLADGNKLSRTVVAVVSVLNIAVTIFALFVPNNGNRGTVVGSGIVSLIILLILYSRKSNAFFDSRSS